MGWEKKVWVMEQRRAAGPAQLALRGIWQRVEAGSTTALYDALAGSKGASSHSSVARPGCRGGQARMRNVR
jgi:hypothetical protein